MYVPIYGGMIYDQGDLQTARYMWCWLMLQCSRGLRPNMVNDQLYCTGFIHMKHPFSLLASQSHRKPLVTLSKVPSFPHPPVLTPPSSRSASPLIPFPCALRHGAVVRERVGIAWVATWGDVSPRKGGVIYFEAGEGRSMLPVLTCGRGPSYHQIHY